MQQEIGEHPRCVVLIAHYAQPSNLKDIEQELKTLVNYAQIHYNEAQIIIVDDFNLTP